MIDIDIRSAIGLSWSSDTAAADNALSPTTPAAGPCDVTSLVLRAIVGGDLKMAQVFRSADDGTYTSLLMPVKIDQKTV